MILCLLLSILEGCHSKKEKKAILPWHTVSAQYILAITTLMFNILELSKTQTCETN